MRHNEVPCVSALRLQHFDSVMHVAPCTYFAFYSVGLRFSCIIRPVGVLLDEDCAIAFAVVEAQFSDLKLLSPDMLVPDTTLAHILGLFQPLLLDAVRVRARSADLVGKVARSIMQPT